MNRFFALAITLIFTSLIPLGFNACRGPNGESNTQETIIGNPITDFSFSPYAPKGIRNIIEFCIDSIIFHQRDGGSSAKVKAQKKVSLSHLGNVISSDAINFARYSRVEVTLRNICGSDFSARIENGHGIASTISDLNLVFEGNQNMGGSKGRIDLQIQSFVDVLPNIMNSAQLDSAINNNMGTFSNAVPGWKTVSSLGAPPERTRHTATWSGSEMIIWGGTNNSGSQGDGGRYDPIADQWRPIISSNSAPARHDHAAVWTGEQMVIWGGRFGDDDLLNTGALYDPKLDNWVSMSTIGAPTPRRGVVLVWTGTYVVIWGGINDSSNRLRDGARYNVQTNTWTPMTTINAPSPREDYSAQWTGKHLLIWGGLGEVGDYASAKLYDPQLDEWSDLPDSPIGEVMAFLSVWTGTKFLAWGGWYLNANTNRGFIFDLGALSWSEMANTGAPSGRVHESGVWSGDSLLVWGGTPDDLEAVAYDDGYRYFAESNNWQPFTAVGQPSARWRATSVWTGTEMIVWGGSHPAGFHGSGGRYSP